ncbi:MAG: hypothetical protein V1818_00145 [Candidatus Aenigmatarchaeota archaeon]
MKEEVRYYKVGSHLSMISHSGPGGCVSHPIMNPEGHVFYLPKEGLMISKSKVSDWLPCDIRGKIPENMTKIEIEGYEIEKIMNSYKELKTAEKKFAVDAKKQSGNLRPGTMRIIKSKNYLEKFSKKCEEVFGEYCN